MNRLFNTFDKQTHIPFEFVRRQRDGYIDPPPPPKPWYVKFKEWFLALFGVKLKVKPDPWYPTTIAEVSMAFNRWRTGVWNYNRYTKGIRPRKVPFGDRVAKFEIRKWIEQKYGSLNQ